MSILGTILKLGAAAVGGLVAIEALKSRDGDPVQGGVNRDNPERPILRRYNLVLIFKPNEQAWGMILRSLNDFEMAFRKCLTEHIPAVTKFNIHSMDIYVPLYVEAESEILAKTKASELASLVVEDMKGLVSLGHVGFERDYSNKIR